MCVHACVCVCMHVCVWKGEVNMRQPYIDHRRTRKHSSTPQNILPLRMPGKHCSIFGNTFGCKWVNITEILGIHSVP